MKRTSLFILIAFLFVSCTSKQEQLTITPQMSAALVAREEQITKERPDLNENVAKECREHPMDIFKDVGTGRLVIICAMPSGSWGVVTMSEASVFDTFSFNALSLADAEKALGRK